MKNKFVRLFLVAVIGVLIVYLILPKPQNDAVIQAPPPAPAQPPPVTEPELQPEPEPEPVEEEPVQKETQDYPVGNTPEEAWQILIQAWRNEVESSNLGIYTYMTKFIRWNNPPERPLHINEPYEIRQKGDYAAVLFERLYPPFLLAKTSLGWQFDDFHQRKIIRKTRDFWGIEKYVSPYSSLLRRLPELSNIDMPLEEKDIYKVSRDKEFVLELTRLENLYAEGKLSYEQAVSLGRLYAISTLGTKAVQILDYVKDKQPENPDLYKYLAIAYVDTYYDYEAAQIEIEKYIELTPANDYGHNFLGFLFMQREKSKEAEAEFKKALEVNSQSCYAYSKLAGLYYHNDDKEKFEKMFQKTKQFCKGKEYERFVWLVQQLHKEKP